MFWPRHGYDDRLGRLIDSSSSLTAKKECRVEPSQHRKHRHAQNIIRLGDANCPGRVHHDGDHEACEGTVWHATYAVTRNGANAIGRINEICSINEVCWGKNRLSPVGNPAA
ncbi:hypothetical protein [Rubripirellula obstinata]|uniref:hypothetical protein n=1 Tax=Rubripirellula obstinata TaxID=406547 RepID=UPI001358D131|nr:hypothetical protein [Rubripirellula obstinata]